jgi:hypothetical protein
MDNSILAEKPVLEINNVVYSLRRLGICDVFAVSKMLAPHVGKLLNTTSKNTEQAGAELITNILLVLPDVGDAALDFFASLLGVEKSQLENPDIFPLPAWERIIGAFLEHPDLQQFWESLRPRLGLGNNANPQTQTN